MKDEARQTENRAAAHPRRRGLAVCGQGLVAIGLAFAALSAPQAYTAENPIKIALIADKTGPLEAYAKQTSAGFAMGLDYATGGTSSAVALAMLPVAQDNKKIFIVEPAVADSITGDKWNRYIFRTARNSTQDALAGAVALGKGDVSVGMLAQDYAFGRDGIAAFKAALAEAHSDAKVVFEEYAPFANTDFTASAQRLFDALKDRPGRKIIAIIWAGPSPLAEIADFKPERYGIALSPGGNILPVMKQYRPFPGMEGAIYYYYSFPKNAMNDWLVTEHQKRFNMPPDFFTCGGMAAASAVVTAVKKAGGTDTQKLIAAMEGMEFDTPKGRMVFRKDDHQALQSMYVFKVKSGGKDEWDLLDLVREITISELPVPIRNKR